MRAGGRKGSEGFARGVGFDRRAGWVTGLALVRSEFLYEDMIELLELRA